MHETERHTPARLYDARRDEMKCESACKKDPVFGVIGVQ